MDHTDVIERGLIEGYHRGLLPPEVEAEFEAHFFVCPLCVEQLEAARGFQRGLKALSVEEAARATVQAGLLAWLARRRAAVRVGLPLALLVPAAGLPSLWLWRERGAAREAGTENAALRARARRLEERLAAEERARAESVRSLEERLAAATAAPPSADGPRGPEPPAPPAPRSAGPLVDTPVFLLSLIRGSAAEGGPVVDSGRGGSHFTLALDVDDALGVESYRVTVTDAQGRERFRRAGLRRNSLETVLLTFPARYFPPGAYTLKVEGLPGATGPVEMGSYRFRVAP
jgi:hypothetical protein